MHQQMRNKAARTQEVAQATIRDQTTGAGVDSGRSRGRVQMPTALLPEAGSDPATQQSEARRMGVPALSGQASNPGSPAALKFPSVHIETHNGDAGKEGDEQVDDVDHGARTSGPRPGRRRLQNKGATCSAVTAELPPDGISPSSTAQAYNMSSNMRKGEREILSNEDGEPRQQAKDRLSRQGRGLGSETAHKGPPHALVESLSEASPGYRLPHNFDHDVMLSAEHNREGFEQLLGPVDIDDLDDLQHNEESIRHGRDDAEDRTRSPTSHT